MNALRGILLCVLVSATPVATVLASEAPSSVRRTGEALYAHWCADCHASGPGHPGTLRLQGRAGGSAPVLLARANNPDLIRVVVRNGIQMMPPFRVTEISAEELERLVRFLSEARQ